MKLFILEVINVLIVFLRAMVGKFCVGGFVLIFGKFKGVAQAQKVFFCFTVIKYEESFH